MITAALAAKTSAALLEGLQGKHRPQSAATAGQAARQFGQQLEALLPGVGTASAALGSVQSLGQDLLGTLGIGAGGAPSRPAAPPRG